MGNLRTLNLLAAFAFGAAGYVSCKLIDEIKEKNQYIKKLDDLLLDYWKNEVA